MALLTKYGNFNVPINHPNTQTITGLGFQPKAVIFFSHYIDGSTNQDAWEHPIGFATSSADTALVGINSSAFGDGSHKRDTANALYNGLSTSAGTEEFSAVLTSFNADGFTVTWNTPSFSNNFPPKDVHYLAIGGSDVINAKVHNAGVLSGSGNKAYTGLGFQPNSMLFLTSLNSPQAISVGAANGTSQYLFAGGINGVSSGAHSMFRSGFCIGTVRGSNGSQQTMGTLVSFDADGYTINHATAATGTTLDVLALKLANPLAIGAFQEPTTASTQVISGFGKTPKAMWFLSRHLVPNTTSGTDMRWSQGVTDGTNQYSVTLHRPHTKATHAFQRYDKAINLIEGTYSTPIVQASAAVTLDTDGFTATWSAVHATQRELMYIAFVEAPAGVIETGAYSFSADSTATITTQRRRSSSLAASTNVAFEVNPVVMREASYTLDAEATIQMISQRFRDSSLTAAIDSTLTSHPSRLMESSIDVLASLDAIYSAQRIGGSSFDLASELVYFYSLNDYRIGEFLFTIDSQVENVGNIVVSAALDIAAQSALDYTARPILIRTYEEAFGINRHITTVAKESTPSQVVRSGLAKAKQIPMARRLIHPRNKGEES